MQINVKFQNIGQTKDKRESLDIQTILKTVFASFGLVYYYILC